MMRGFRLGKILGFDISIDWSWLLIFFLVAFTLAQYYFPMALPQATTGTNWALGLLASLLLFASVLAHELSHSVVARRYGQDVKGITLFLFGGMSQTAEEPKSPKEEFWMAIAGPITSFAIAAMFFIFSGAATALQAPVWVNATLDYLWFINLVLGIFNLVPGFPLDGGRVLRSAIWAGTNNLKTATQYASWAGQGFGYFLMGAGIIDILVTGNLMSLWLVFIGWFIAGAARSSYQQLLVRQALSGVHVDQVMTTDVPTIPADMSLKQFVDEYLLRHEYSCYPVMMGEEVTGVIGIEEVRKVPPEQREYARVGDVVHSVDNAYKVEAEDDVWDAVTKLADESVCRLLVMEDNHLKGTVGRETVFRLVQHRMQFQA